MSNYMNDTPNIMSMQAAQVGYFRPAFKSLPGDMWANAPEGLGIEMFDNAEDHGYSGIEVERNNMHITEVP